MTFDEALTLKYHQVEDLNYDVRANIFDAAVNALVAFGFEESRARHVIRANAQVLRSLGNVPLTEEQALHLESAATVIRFRR